MSEKIENYLAKLENELIGKKWRLVEFSEEWLSPFKNEAGVYAVKEEGTICYVGETSCIRKTMEALRDTRKHPLRRRIGKQRFRGVEGYETGSSGKPFPPKFETELNRIFEDNFEVAAIVVKIGRKELEERLVEKFNPVYNKTAITSPERSKKAFSLEEKRKEHKNAYQPWTEEEENQVIQLVNEGKSNKEIGIIVGRNRGAISSRLKKINERDGIGS